MSGRFKIAVVSGTRADYGLLKPVLQRLRDDGELELQLFLTGMHLVADFGRTELVVAQDGFEMTERVEMLLSSDTAVGITKSTGLGIIGFADVFERHQPDILIALGDRFELFSAVTAALMRRLPVAHIHGGEGTHGVIDEAIRHAVSKMSYLHFTATEDYRRRVIQMGEAPERVFNVGALAVEIAASMDFLSRAEIGKLLDIEIGRPFFVVTFHPATLEISQAAAQCQAMLDALVLHDEASIVVTYPNADTDSRSIIPLIEEFCAKAPSKRTVMRSLGQRAYMSCLKEADVVVGKSSSGIIEAPLFATPTVDIGDRQRGRVVPDSVIRVGVNKADIDAAIRKALSSDFRGKLKSLRHPYGNGDASSIIVKQVKAHLATGIDLKKSFHDLPTGREGQELS